MQKVETKAQQGKTVLGIDLWTSSAGPRETLGEILDSYLGSSSWTLARTSSGKPFLEGSPLHFNLSHGDGLVMVAVSLTHHVGVDIESWRRVPRPDLTITGAFSEDDQRYLESGAPSERDRMILKGWVRKEACLKALGTGLLHSPKSVPAGFAGDQTVHLMGQAVRVSSVEVPEGYVGAVARLEPAP